MKLLFFFHFAIVLGPVAANLSLYQAAGARDPHFFYTPPPKLSAKGIELVQSYLFQKYLEYDFVSKGIQNYSSSGYEGYPNITAKTLTGIKAVLKYQLNITKDLLESSGATPIRPCKYRYEAATKFSDWITLARLFFNADIDFAAWLSKALGRSDPDVAIALTASVPVTARWDAFIHSLNGFEIFEGAFATLINPQFAYHIERYFIVPGSCPSIPANVTDLPRARVPLPSLTHTSDYVIALALNWVWDPNEVPQATPGATIYVAYHNQLSKPEYLPLNITSPGRGVALRPTDVFGQTYAVFTNTTTATDIASLTAIALTGPLVLNGPFR